MKLIKYIISVLLIIGSVYFFLELNELNKHDGNPIRIKIPFIESVNKFQNPFRRPIAMTFFIIGTFVAIWLGIGATLPIDISLTLGLFLCK